MWKKVGHTLSESTVSALERLASLLPGIVALAIVVMFSWGLAWLVTVILRRVFERVQLDKRLEERGWTAVSAYSPHRSPALLVTRVAAWSIVALGFVVGLGALDSTLTSQLTARLFDYLPNLITSIVVLVAGTVIARYLARSVLIESVNMNLQYARLLSVGVKWLVMVLTIAMTLDHLEIGAGVVHLAFAILFGGIVLALALAVGLGSKEMVSRSLERESIKASADTEEPLRHL